MNRKRNDGENRVTARPAGDCKHPNKYYYKTNDGKDHWICRDCSATDLG